jgi:hypothetical protein
MPKLRCKNISDFGKRSRKLTKREVDELKKKYKPSFTFLECYAGLMPEPELQFRPKKNTYCERKPELR